MKNTELFTLIQTKVSRPPTRKDLVPRQRLFTQLDYGLERPLTLVCAGAGFGKTTLVSAWLHNIATQQPADKVPPIAWLSLDEHDSDLSLFLRYFVAAVHEAAPDVCQETAEMLVWRVEPSVAQLFASLNNDLACLPQKLIIVLDDYHVIRGTAVHDFLSDLLLHWPEPLHLIIISRFTPPLPIARFRANGTMVEIRNKDLRFTSEEVAEYVYRMWPVSLSQSNLELLEQKTEGWIAGLQLASLSLRVMENVETVLTSLSGTNADIADYLIDEVLSRQPSAFHMFQLKTSILDQFCPSLCEAIMAHEDPDWTARAILDWLEHGNLFIIPLDNRKEWYRYHPLFRDLLQERLLARLGQDEINDLHQRAANWFAQNDFWLRAVDHALNTQDLGQVAQLMRQGLPNVLNREDQSTLERWLSVLPETFINSRPDILIIKAWSLHFAWQLTAVSKVIQEIETLLEQGDWATQLTDYYQILLGQITDLKAQEAYHKGQHVLCLTYCQEALALLPASWTFLRGGVMLYLALGMQAIGQGAVVEQMLLELYEPLSDKTDAYALRLLLGLCFNYTQAGQFEKAEQTASHMLKKAEQQGLFVVQGWAYLILGIVHYQWDHLDIAGQYFDNIITKRYKAHALAAREGLIGAALVHLASGRHAEAWQVLELLSQFDLERYGRLEDVTQSLRARLLLADGNMEDAGRWADAYTMPVAQEWLVLVELPHLTKAQVLLARNDEASTLEALQLLDKLLAVAEQNHTTRRKIEILVLSALALDVLDQTAEALALLEQAVKLSREGKFIRIFVDSGPRMCLMLYALTSDSPYAECAARILLAFPKEGLNGHALNHRMNSAQPTLFRPLSPDTPELVESLTTREVQVLTLLREPLSAKEIALKLNISYATAKRHSINLYGKLGVNSRWDAVATAESLGLLPPRP